MNQKRKLDPLSEEIPAADRASIASVVRRIESHYPDRAAEQIIKEAREAWSPLHRFFEWDDSVAGDRYRLRQAERLLVIVRVEVVTPPKVERKERERVRYRDDRGSPAPPVRRSEVDPGLSERRAATRELEAWLLKHKRLSDHPDFAAIFRDINALITKRKAA